MINFLKIGEVLLIAVKLDWNSLATMSVMFLCATGLFTVVCIAIKEIIRGGK